MPVVKKRNLSVDYSDDGSGPTVVLVHSSVSGNRQWRALIDDMRSDFRILAINLFGYGETSVWPDRAPQSLYAQAQLVLALCEQVDGPVNLVGHSFGGSVAMKATHLLAERVEKLVLLEPNPFYLLRQSDTAEAYLESCTLRDHVKCYGSLGDWTSVAERFADYWLGGGAWEAMPEKRRVAFASSLPPNFHEWDVVMNEETTFDEWRTLRANTLVVHDPNTRLPIREIVRLLQQACISWSFKQLPRGGHMAPLTHPELVNPIVRHFLRS
jgi:pimeloyl-ACP methyl ester carboxylesterase